MKVDVVLCYEHWQRELLAIINLKIELEKKGFTVKLLNIQTGVSRFLESYIYEPEIVYYPWVYSNKELKRARDFRGDCQKIINAQCEQLLSKRAQETGFFTIREQAKNAFHVSWGEISEKRYIDWGIEQEHIWDIGNINLEINMPEFNSCFYGRQQIAEKYNLDINKKWLLFCSNYKFAETYYHDIEEVEKRSPGILILAKEMKKSKKKILEWMKCYLSENNDVEIIYRPHPLEARDKKLDDLQKEITLFKYISDYSVNQWVRVCDICTTWGSTSVLDSVFINKASAYLIPGAYPDILNGDTEGICPVVDNYHDFEKLLKLKEIPNYECSKVFCGHITRTENGSFDNMVNSIEQLYHKNKISYFRSDETNYVKWARLSIAEKYKLIIFWIVKHLKIYCLLKSGQEQYKEAYDSKIREKQLYKLMKKGKKDE